MENHAPKIAQEYLRDKLFVNNLGYTVTLGIPELRKKFQNYIMIGIILILIRKELL